MRRTTQIALIFLLCALAVSSCKKKAPEPKAATAEIAANTAKLQKAIKKHVDDDMREENLLILVRDVDIARGKLTQEWMDMQQTLLSNPAWTREEADAEIAKFQEVRVELIRDMAAARLAMRKYATEKEWKALFPEPKKKEGDDKGDVEEAAEAPAEAPVAEEEATENASAEEAPAADEPSEAPTAPESEE